MKVLLVNGSPHKEGCTYTALTEVAKTLNEEKMDFRNFNMSKIFAKKLIEKEMQINADGI